jgi:uncharacterized membrane protein
MSSMGAGALVVTPIYLAILLLLKAAKALAGFVRPLVKLLPDWIASERAVALLLVFCVCFLTGVVVRTSIGRSAFTRAENAVFRKMPGYDLLRSLTQRVAGDTHDQAWTPALAEIEEALVPAFIIEVLDDGRFTVFVPSVPTPLSGALYILTPERVHPLDVPFGHVVKTVARWGEGSKDLAAGVHRSPLPPHVPVA